MTPHTETRFNIQKQSERLVFLPFSLWNVLRATVARTLFNINYQRWSQTLSFELVWLANLFGATTACTSKTGPQVRCFHHLDFQMCFAPQPRAAVQRLNFQKCSDAEVFFTCALRHVLLSTAASSLWISHLAKVLRNVVLYVLTSKRASRHYGVQFFISHLTRWLRTRRLGEPTFQASRATKHWENAVLGHFSTLPRTLIFFLDLLSSDSFSSLTLPTSSASSAHIVDSLTSKLPSINYLYIHVYIYIHTYITLHYHYHTYIHTYVCARMWLACVNMYVCMYIYNIYIYILNRYICISYA